MKFFQLGRRGLITVVFLIIASSLAIGISVFERVQNDHSPWHVGNGWGICGGYGTKFLKEIPTEIESAIYSYLHIPRNSVGAITFGTEVTAVDPTKESSFPHSCTSPLVDIGGTDATIANILTTPQTYQVEVAKTLAKDRKRYSGVIPPGATKAIQILVSEYVEWPNYSGHDPYFFQFVR